MPGIALKSCSRELQATCGITLSNARGAELLVMRQGEKVMDIGSRGGAWTKKSPKLLLLEWTQSHKQPKPRFKSLPADASKFRCKVCLP